MLAINQSFPLLIFQNKNQHYQLQLKLRFNYVNYRGHPLVLFQNGIHLRTQSSIGLLIQLRKKHRYRFYPFPCLITPKYPECY